MNADSVPDTSHAAEAPTKSWSLTQYIGLKGMLVLFASMSLAFSIGSIAVDTYISTHSGHPVKLERLEVEVGLIETKIGSVRMAVIPGPNEQEQIFSYSALAAIPEKDGSRSVDDKSLENFLSSDLVNTLGFRLPITSIEYASGVGTLVRVLEALSICFTGLAIILQLVFRADPDSFILRPGISARVSISKASMLKSGLPGFCLLLAAGCSMIHAVAISSFIHNMVYRVVAYSIFNSGVGGGQLAAFRVAMKGASVGAKQEQLKLMQFIGKFLTKPDNVSFGFSFYAALISIGFNLVVLFALYYNDNTAARTRTAAAVVPAPSAAESQWKLLPWHCRVRPIWASLIIFFVGIGVTAVGGNIARRRGVKMNRHPFEVAGEARSFIDDVVISHTNDYFFSTAGIVDGAVMIFMPLLVTVAISSLDRVKFASKVFELLGVIFFMRGISVMSTIMPTLFNVLQHPQCWDKPGTTLMEMVAEKEFCNDLMFSGHTVFCFLPALIFVFSIVHGPYSYKPLLIASVLLTASALTSLIIIGRLHYTADVIVAVTITALLVIMNAPVWKLQFSFRKSQLGVGSISAIDKVPGYLELCIERLNLFTITVQDTVVGKDSEEGMHAETWSSIDVSYAQLGDLIEQVKADSCQAERLENEEEADEPVIEEIHAEQREPLLSQV